MKYISTKNMSEKEWLKKRKEFIGASEIPIILGMSPFQTPYQLFLEKIEEEVDEVLESKEQEDRLIIGKLTEEANAKLFEMKTGLKTKKDLKIRISEEHPFLSASIDRIAIKDKTQYVLELKHLSREIDELPDYIYAQIQQQLFIFGGELAYCSILIGNQKHIVIEVVRDEEQINMQINEAIKFYNNLTQYKILKKELSTCSDPIKASDIRFAMNQLLHLYMSPQDYETQESKPNSIIDGEPIKEIIDNYISLKNKLKELNNEIDEYENQIKQFMENNEQLNINNTPVITWKTYQQASIQIKLLKEKYPDIYKELSEVKKVRKFTLINNKKGDN